MVAVQRRQTSSKLGTCVAAALAFLVAVLVMVFRSSDSPAAASDETPAVANVRVESQQQVRLSPPNADKDDADIQSSSSLTCPYRSFDDLTPEELHPQKGQRHMVTPPEGGDLTLVCCETTKGPWNIVVHERWAPRGAARFMEMVSSKYMNGEVPLFRCTQTGCQFGLSSDKSLSHLFEDTIKDDRNWLPEGKEHRQNDEGTKRFAQGYLAYAGNGKDSRSKQLIISLTNVPTLAGGSPWEVPWGELVGAHSFETLAKIYTGYGDNGPKQGLLWRHGMTQDMRSEFPELDYLKSCHVVDRRTQEEPAS